MIECNTFVICGRCSRGERNKNKKKNEIRTRIIEAVEKFMSQTKILIFFLHQLPTYIYEK